MKRLRKTTQKADSDFIKSLGSNQFFDSREDEHATEIIFEILKSTISELKKSKDSEIETLIKGKIKG